MSSPTTFSRTNVGIAAHAAHAGTARSDEPRLARIASLLADGSRARMLGLLLGGEYASAGELARAAGISPATASAHLAQLQDGGLIACEARGRHRYFRLADGEVAHALEALALVAERGSHERVWASPARARLRLARCCYGHLAGRLGVDLLRGLLRDGCLAAGSEGRYAVTDAGVAALGALGLDGKVWQRRQAWAAAVAVAAEAAEEAWLTGAWIGPSAATTWPGRWPARC